MKKEWEYKGKSPIGGNVYHKNRNIMIIYSNGAIVIHQNVPVNKSMIPINAQKTIRRNV